MTYKLLTGTIKALPDKVNEYLRDGWTLFGSPFLTGQSVLWGHSDGTPIYKPEIAQAIYTRD
ncbi:MAG: DUF1737 domain-containing protein [Pseudomonadota bacterium]